MANGGTGGSTDTFYLVELFDTELLRSLCSFITKDPTHPDFFNTYSSAIVREIVRQLHGDGDDIEDNVRADLRIGVIGDVTIKNILQRKRNTADTNGISSIILRSIGGLYDFSKFRLYISIPTLWEAPLQEGGRRRRQRRTRRRK